MKQLQDTLLENVQQFISSYFDDSLTENQINEINQELEVKILASFYEHGITSTHKTIYSLNDAINFKKNETINRNSK